MTTVVTLRSKWKLHFIRAVLLLALGKHRMKRQCRQRCSILQIIQVSVNLIDWSLDFYVDDKLVHQRVYGSLQELIDGELYRLDFTELMAVPLPEEEAEIEAPASGPGQPAEKEKEGGKPTPAYDLGYGHMGNGLTVWNRLRTVHGDYQTVAHIEPDRSVTIYDTDMPDEVRQQIYDVAATSDARISATQDAPVFSTPPHVQEPEVTAEAIPAPPPRRERVTFTTLRPEIPADQRHNFRITDPELGYGTPSEKYAANVAAIRTLKRIEAEERLATPEEQEVLSRYVGWGGLADCFDERHSKYQELKSLLDDDEYAAARASSLTAFYTSPVIIEAMYKALAQVGFQSGNILEPACGVGNFIGMIPEDMAGSHAYGVEIDSISGRIAQQLYQLSSISVNGFEKVQMPDSFFDVAIGNVPFGDLRVADRRYDKHHWLIHDYFFGKALDKVRPGGVIAFISSKGTMDKESSAVRKYLAQRADLIGAIRLPDNAFKRNAGTEVTSDIIFLQKRDRLTDIEPDWVHLDTTEDGIRMNSYFVQHPEMVLGNMVMESTRFGMDSACKAYEDADLSQLLAEAITNLHAEITAYEQDDLDAEQDESIPADPDVRNFNFTIVDGTIYYRENSIMRPVKTSATAENRIRGMIALRDCARQLIEMQAENYPDGEIAAQQQKLNRLYDDFVRKYDRLNTRGNRLAFEDDSSYYLLCSLEVYDKENNFERKADMFTKRTIRPHEPVTHVDTAAEALAVSITERARVDMAYMSELSGMTPEAMEEELSGVIFRDVNCAEDPKDIAEAQKDMGRYPLVPADEYLSGNVRKKLRMARAMREALPAEERSRLDRNVAALEAVQPQDLSAGEIGVRIGASWVPISDYEDFMYELFGTSYYARQKIKITHSKFSGEWNISNKTYDRVNIKIRTTYGTDRVNGYLYVVSKMRNVGGISQTDAQKSSDLFMKTQYLDELTDYRGTIFATGTPISNSMVELYTIQRYLQYQVLQEMGLVFFDDWASSFGETITSIELAPEGSGYRAKTRFAKFYNLPELMATFKQVADIQTADMLKLPVPKANFHTEVIAPSELQKEMVAGLAERAEKIRAGKVDPTDDNMLKVTNDCPDHDQQESRSCCG